MKILALTFFVCVCSIVVSGQELFIDTAQQNSINDSNGVYNSMWSPGYLNTQPGNFQSFNAKENYRVEGDEAEPLNIFKLDTITLNDFSKYKKKYKTHLNKDSSKIRWTDTSFIIKFEKTERIFVANRNDYSFFEYYLGLLEPLNLFIINGIDGHNEIGLMELIDKRTGKSYGFGSPSDYPVETVCISPKYNYLLGYVNDLYEGNSFISIVIINTKKNNYILKDFCGINMDETHIKDLVWIDENSFAIAADETYTYDTVAPKYYLRISFK
jgi:hypothetical protein